MFAAIHLDAPGILLLDRELAIARKRPGLPSNHVFNRHRADQPTVGAVVGAALTASATASVHILHKPSWRSSQPRWAGWGGCVCDGILRLAVGLALSIARRQVLQIDLSPDEDTLLEEYRDKIRQAIRAQRPSRPSFKSIRACPDDGSRGSIIQVADKLAGEVRQQGGIGGAWLLGWGNAIRLIP